MNCATLATCNTELQTWGSAYFGKAVTLQKSTRRP